MPRHEKIISTTEPALNDAGWGTEVTVTIDVDRLIETRLLAEANSGGGKSYLLRRILEQTYGKAQHIIIDVEDEFHTLRELYDYVLCAPRGGDCVADCRSAALLARRLLELGASAIIAINELGVQQARFVRLFLESLMSAPRDLWHSVIVVVDEAHKFCPEKDQAESASAVIDLMTRGRKRGFCGMLATQRLSKLNKDAAAEANNLLIGRTALDLDIARASAVLGMPIKEARAVLPKLEPGEFFCVGPALSPSVERIHIGGVKTSHPRAGTRGAPPTPARDKVRSILAKLADLPAEAEEEAKTMTELRAKVRELEGKLKTVGEVDDDAVEKLRGDLQNQIDHIETMRKAAEENASYTKLLEKAYGKAVDDIDNSIEGLINVRNGYAATVAEHVAKYPIDLTPVIKKAVASGKHVQNAARSNGHHRPLPDRPPPVPTSAGGLPPMQRAFLTALAQRGPLSKAKLLVFTGYSRGGAVSRCFAELVRNDWCRQTGDSLEITELGRAHLGPFEPLPIGRELRDKILRELPQMERSIFDAICDAYPNAITKQDVLYQTGYSRGGAVSRAFAYLTGRDYVVSAGPSRLCAAKELFE